MSGQVVQEQIVQEPVLTALDRCDGCGAQAYVKVELGTGDFLFCMHHWNTPGVKEKLVPVAVHVHDETHRLK